MIKKTKQKNKVESSHEQKENIESIVHETKNEHSKRFNKKHYGYLAVGVVVIVVLLALLYAQLETPKVKVGSIIKVDYVGSLEDGTVFDTSIKEIGEKAGLKRPQYDSFQFQVGSGQAIQGFDQGVVGMVVGEKKTLTITPDKAYGNQDPNKILKANREIFIQHITQISTENFKNFFKADPVVGKEITTQELPWKLKIQKIENSTIYLENLLTNGQKVVLPGTSWESQINSIGESIKIIQNPKIGDLLSFPTAQGSVMGTIVKVDGTSFSMNTNHPLAGKTLMFEITVREIKQ